MGLPSSVIEGLVTAEPQGFQVWPTNMTVVDTWLVIASQWRTAPLADGRLHWLGLDYASSRAGLDMAGVTVSPIEWAGIQVMEREASAALNDVRG